MISRINSLRTLLTEQSLDAALISSVPDIIYLTNFTSFSAHEREAFLLITQKHQYIFTDARYTHAVTSHVKKFTLCEIGSNKSFTHLLQEIIQRENITQLGIDKHDLTAHEFEIITEKTKNLKHFSPRKLRLIKSSKEIRYIQKACALGDKTFTYILKKIKVGITEKEVAYILEQFIRKNNSEPSFPTIVAFGKNAAVPHHKTSSTPLKTRDLILLDFGVQYESYCSDMTRTFFLGTPTQEQKNAYEIVQASQKKAFNTITNCLAKLKPIEAAKIDAAARDYILKREYPSIPHSLGHGIGLEVHEAPTLSPKSNDLLEDGMVFSIEPGIYLNDKFGIRIEDLFTIQHNKLIQLTKAPNNLIKL